ncbi:MAG: DNA polymerase III subunit delta [Candidatus Zixiibacteriota bacterium]
MSPNELSKELAAGKFRSLYYFYGAEDYRIKEAEKTLIGRFLPKTQLTTNHTNLSASKNKFDDIITELSVIPMLGERQTFTIADIQSLTTKQIDKIIAMTSPPDPNRILIFSSPSSKTPKKKSAMLQHLLANTTAVDFPRLSIDSAKTRIHKILKPKNIQIETEALDFLIELSDGDFGGMMLEVNKLIDFVGENGNISLNEIKEITSDYQAFTIFEVAGNAILGEYDKAITILQYLMNKGDRATNILFWISEHFLGLYLAQNKKQFGKDKRDNSWKFKGQLNRLENEHLEQIIHLIAEADRDLRSNLDNDGLILEKLIYQICSIKNS